MKNCCNTEHYVVKPNIPVYDWPYEYSTGNNRKECNCSCNSEAIMVVMSNLQTTISALQNKINDALSTGINIQQLKPIVERIAEEYLNTVGTLEDIINSILDNKLGDINLSDINGLKSKVLELEGRLNSILPTDLSDLQNQLSLLRNIVNGLSSSLTDTINNKVSQAINGNSTINQLGSTVGLLELDLNNHINNTNLHFKSGDIHVTQNDVDRWNAAVSSTSDIRFTVVNKTLKIAKA